MNKKVKYILIVVVVLTALSLFFMRTYISSPGFVTQETAEEFYDNAKRCLGFSILLNAEQVAADAPGKSLCIGYLK
jgi:hypothetical protein